MTEMHVYKAINDVMAALSREGIAKTGRNTQGTGYNFRGIDHVLNALSSHLVEAKLVIVPRVMNRDQIERISKNGGALFYTSIDVEFDLISAVDGSKHTARTFGEAMDSGDKSTNKAMSVAYKYMALQTFCVPTEAGEDTDNYTHEVEPKGADKRDGAVESLWAELCELRSEAGLKSFWMDNAKGIAGMDAANKARFTRKKDELKAAFEKPRDVVDDIQDTFPGAEVVNVRTIRDMHPLEAG